MPGVRRPAERVSGENAGSARYLSRHVLSRGTLPGAERPRPVR